MDIRTCLSYDDILLVPRYSANLHLNDADIYYNYDKIPRPFKAIPIFNSPMDKVCSKELLECIYNDFDCPITIHRYFKNVQEQLELVESLELKDDGLAKVFLAVGSIYKWKDWINYLLENTKYNLSIDMAQGDSIACIDTVKYIHDKKPSINIMAGDIATKSGLNRLYNAGAQLIRCGVGPGSICATRKNCAFGVPVLTTIMDCNQIKSEDCYLIADGGINASGDIVKALVCGADAVMIGKMLAATDLSPGVKYNKNREFTDDNTKMKWVEYRGQASHSAQQLLDNSKIHSIEGVSGLIPYAGTTKFAVNSILQNLRSAVAYYGGCKDWKEMKRVTKIIQITNAGREESSTNSILQEN